MKTLIILFLSCASVAASDTGIRVVTTATADTVTIGAIVTTDTYTRDGEKDLVRITKSQNGVVTYRSHGFYHDEKLVAVYTWRPQESTFAMVPGSPYYVGLNFLPSNGVKSVTIWGSDFIDAFYPTNGVYYPVTDSDLKAISVK